MMDKASNGYILYQTRYYNEVFGAINDFPVPTSQTKDKNKIIEFKNRVNGLLDSQKNDKWPYKSKLTLTVIVKGTEKYLNRIDIDNVLKLLLDILKKKLFVDDKQIFSIMASKDIIENHNDVDLHGFMFGLRVLEDNEMNLCIPELLSQNPSDKITNNETTNWKSIEV